MCIRDSCCTLRGDLLATVKELSEEMDASGAPAWEYLMIESSGISEPLPIAQTFVMDVNSCAPESGADHHHPQNHADFVPLYQYARLDTLVTVVDLFNVLHILGSRPICQQGGHTKASAGIK